MDNTYFQRFVMKGRKKVKLGIIGGAGLVGSTAAFLIGVQNLVSEIMLVDLNMKMKMSHVMDMGQAMLEYSDTKIVAGEYADLAKFDIILLSASLPERNVQSRNEYLKGNLGIVESVCAELKKLPSEKILIMATNPIDVFNYIAWKNLGWDRRKFIGFSYNDTIRMKWALSKAKKLKYSNIDALCVGEHGDGQVPLYQSVSYNNKPLGLESSEVDTVKSMVTGWFTEYQSLESGRTSGWTSAAGLAEVVKRITGSKKSPISCSVILDGENGFTDVSIGTPVVLNSEGVERIDSLILGKEERIQYNEAAKKIRGLISSVGY